MSERLYNTPPFNQTTRACTHSRTGARGSSVGAVLHPLRADAARALMAARHGEVRLRMHHTHDARRLAADGELRNVVAARDVAGGWVGVWDWDRRG